MENEPMTLYRELLEHLQIMTEEELDQEISCYDVLNMRMMDVIGWSFNLTPDDCGGDDDPHIICVAHKSLEEEKEAKKRKNK